MIQTKQEELFFYKGIDVTNIYINNNGYSDDFYAGFYGTTNQVNDPTKYRHKLLANSVTFGTPVTCEFDLTCGTLTAASIYGGAATQIQNSINTAIQTTYTKTQVDTALALKANTTDILLGLQGQRVIGIWILEAQVQ